MPLCLLLTYAIVSIVDICHCVYLLTYSIVAIVRDRYRYSIRCQISISYGENYCIENVKYRIVMFQDLKVYRIDLIAI